MHIVHIRIWGYAETGTSDFWTIKKPLRVNSLNGWINIAIKFLGMSSIVVVFQNPLFVDYFIFSRLK